MARFFEWGTAPKAVREGYRMDKVVISTEAKMAKKYEGVDVIIVWGLPCGKPGESEFAIYNKDRKGTSS